MTASEMRALAVKYFISRKGLNSYTNGGDRKYFFGKPNNEVGNTKQKGFSDCSSACRAVFRAAAGIDIGRNTHAQILNRAKGKIVHETTGFYPDESKLLPGDLLYFKGNQYHVMSVGHVELYTGQGTCYGHGSGKGPTKKDLRKYCTSRATQEKRYFMAIRWMPDEDDAPVLGVGDTGFYVSRLQKLLIEAGYPLEKYGADGDFGDETLAALKKFQADAKLSATGVCDAATWEALEKKTEAPEPEIEQNPYPVPKKNIGRGAKGDGVMWIQWELTDAGISCGKYGIDGDFGRDTEAAVLRFQELAFPNDQLEWDGIVGAKTRAKLIEIADTELVQSGK